MQQEKLTHLLSLSFLCTLVLSVYLSATPALSGPPGPGPGPGPAGGPSSGPPDPPRDTPGLDPITLSALAAGGYASFRMYKAKQGK